MMDELSIANPKHIAEAISQQMNTTFNKAALDPNFKIRSYADGIDNPYHVPDPGIMSTLPEARGLPLTKILLDYRKVLPNEPLTDSIVLALVKANVGTAPPKVTEGKVTLEQTGAGAYADITEAARDLTAYYRAGAKYNNDKMRFENFGMQAQTTYNVRGLDYLSYQSVMTKLLTDERKAKATVEMQRAYEGAP